jgi:hypothetical protein
MAELAGHLVEGVIPYVPTRQWVWTMPIALRLYLAADPELCLTFRRSPGRFLRF